jgi:hypothetical protein
MGSYFIFYPDGETVKVERADEADIALNTQGSDPVIKSAHNALDGVRKTKLVYISTADDEAAFEDISEVSLQGWGYELLISHHDVIGLLSESDNHYMKMWVTSGTAGGSPLSGSSPDRYLEFEWDYQTIDNCPFF